MVFVRHVMALGLLATCLLGVGGRAAQARTFTLNHSTASAPPPAAEESKGEGRELFYKIINVVILVGALAYLLKAPLAGFFAQRSADIRKGLEDGRQALAASQAQLQSVEEKLRHLEEEIAAFKASSVQEMEAERRRLKLAAAEEAEKIRQLARTQTEAAVRVARLELKSYAAVQAVELAEEIIRQHLDEAGRKKLVSEFLEKVESRESRVES